MRPPHGCPRGIRRSGKNAAVNGTGWPISRVLYLRSVTGPEAAIIHLGTPLPAPSSGLPGHIGRAALKRVLYGLAPGGVYLADPVTRNAGGLLHHLFTLTAGQFPCEETLQRRFLFCGTGLRVSPSGRYPPPCPAEPGLSSAVLSKKNPTRSPGQPVQPQCYRLGACPGDSKPGRGAGRTSRRINWC